MQQAPGGWDASIDQLNCYLFSLQIVGILFSPKWQRSHRVAKYYGVVKSQIFELTCILQMLQILCHIA